MIQLKEGKQVGTLYHFTRFLRLKRIINGGGLKTNFADYISFSRSPRLPEINPAFEGMDVRLVFDGDKLSNKFKIEPYLDLEFDINRLDGESEERIKWPSSKNLPCLFALKRIDIKKTEDKKIDIEGINTTVPINFVSSFNRQ